MTELPPLADLVATRSVLHRLADDVLAAEQFAAIRTVRLHVTDGGFGTATFPGASGPTRIRVQGLELVREVAGSETREQIPGLDGAAADVLFEWWRLGNDVLAAIALGAGEQISPIVLWPEHFDIAVTVTLAAGSSVNVGFSPGDDFSAEPYVYVGPWQPLTGEFWNAPFGAVRTYSEVHSRPAAIAGDFVAEGLRHLRG